MAQRDPIANAESTIAPWQVCIDVEVLLREGATILSEVCIRFEELQTEGGRIL